MTRKEEEKENRGVAGYTMVDNEGMVHLAFTIFCVNHGHAEIRSGNACNPGRSMHCPSRFGQKLVLLEHCLGEWS